jgi:uracil-DNA glycosylase
VVALGATAVHSLMGKAMTIGKIRGEVVDMPDGGKRVATIHPPYILRIDDERDKQAQYRQFVRDLKAGGKAAGK